MKRAFYDYGCSITLKRLILKTSVRFKILPVCFYRKCNQREGSTVSDLKPVTMKMALKYDWLIALFVLETGKERKREWELGKSEQTEKEDQQVKNHTLQTKKKKKKMASKFYENFIQQKNTKINSSIGFQRKANIK